MFIFRHSLQKMDSALKKNQRNLRIETNLKNTLQKKMAGKFIVLDGPDGCGKSTQAKLLAEYLTAQGVEVLSLRDPGSTPIGEKIRQILLSPEHEAMSLRTEVLLYMAARAQLWSETLAPAAGRRQMRDTGQMAFEHLRLPGLCRRIRNR